MTKTNNPIIVAHNARVAAMNTVPVAVTQVVGSKVKRIILTVATAVTLVTGIAYTSVAPDTQAITIVSGTEVGTVQQAISQVNGDLSRMELQQAYRLFRELNNVQQGQDLNHVQAGDYIIPVIK